MGFLEEKKLTIDNLDKDWKFFKLDSLNILNPIEFEEIKEHDIITVLNSDNKCPIPLNYQVPENVSVYFQVLQHPHLSLDLQEGVKQIGCICCLRHKYRGNNYGPKIKKEK